MFLTRSLFTFSVRGVGPRPGIVSANPIPNDSKKTGFGLNLAHALARSIVETLEVTHGDSKGIISATFPVGSAY
jgi:hypothetical protein